MIYFDYASTSYKKPEEVSLAMYQALKNGIGNSGRGANEVSLEAARILQKGRNAVCQLFHWDNPEGVIFKGSLTDALNTLILGLLQEGDHVITSVMEHNSVLRPLEQLRKNHKIQYDLLPCDETGRILISNIKTLERENTKAIILSQASNLTGTIQPIKDLRKILKNKDIFIIIDAAQSAGYMDVNGMDLDVDGIAFAGHKGLLGPQGIGGFLINSRLNFAMDSVFTGGTGSDSLSLNQPQFLPDKFEAGTPNLPGIVGLAKGIEYISNASSYSYQSILMELFLTKITTFKNIRLIGLKSCKNRVPTFSLIFHNITPSEAAYLLETNYGMIARSGYHCAPLAHKALGTLDSGSLRISFGHFTTKEEILSLLIALKELNEV